ncbi:MAG TPA: response regulator transcription factor [Candidatus Scatomorpha stercorigallinarum]|nr:response regulator transcription factor [Candidatus Scatomorpha stercorigallinarum]
MNNKVLIVDDERAIVDILKYNLEKNGMTAICAYDGGEGLRLARESDPDVILLDVMLPVMDGFEVCRTLRAEGNNVPIIMITAREEETDKVFGLELGADDYITKPFSMREVVARVRTNMRRAVAMAPQSAPEPSGDQLRAKDLTIDKARHAVFKDGKEIELTQREYELILYLAENPGKVISREELMSRVWQYDYYGDLRAVDVAIRRLREKLEPNPSEPEYVMTKRGAGYYFAD